METLKAIFSRQSVRSYLPEQISAIELETLLKAAKAAPIGNGKFGEVHLTVLQNKVLIEKITEFIAAFVGNPNAKPFYGAPTVIIVSCLPGSNLIYANAACMVENMAVAATDLGLGSIYLWGFIERINKNPDLVSHIGLPEGFVMVSALGVGHPVNHLVEREIPEQKVGVNFIP